MFNSKCLPLSPGSRNQIEKSTTAFWVPQWFVHQVQNWSMQETTILGPTLAFSAHTIHLEPRLYRFVKYRPKNWRDSGRTCDHMFTENVSTNLEWLSFYVKNQRNWSNWLSSSLFGVLLSMRRLRSFKNNHFTASLTRSSRGRVVKAMD